MKRGIEAVDVANCLMLLSKVGEEADHQRTKSSSSSKGRLFACKTCNREFPSFQALGGHRASHKKPKLMSSDFLGLPVVSAPPKPKTHECTICGLEFPLGQALGGHMRRHRSVNTNNNTTSSASSGDEPVTRPFLAAPAVPVLKKSPSSKRVQCLDLDFTPEIDLELKLGKAAPVLMNCFVN
ncbi:hypothetical protein Tsubulata_007927 [Turnera subulata]|uniref:C2H2-type domain-containing protein n=1 Tax=Turnera subulata TaxID=218843 RepID=A0A9Q0FQ98_9ROSI|nr:hypothetical protein Tsubulata_007927 [Turnera subulata]